MTTIVPKDRIVQAIAEEFTALEALIADLDERAWSAATPCPGWDVRANVAHVIGTESMLAGVKAPAVEIDRVTAAHVRNDIGRSNEVWVEALRTTPPPEIVDRFRAITTTRLDALRSMEQARWDADGFTPAGRDSYGRFMRIRAFDCWMHEQDIRDALGRPGHDSGLTVEVALDEMVAAMGFVVGKQAGAPEGTAVTFELTGASGRTFHVVVRGRATVVDELESPATTTLRMPVGVFTRLGGGRSSADPSAVSVQGDEALGAKIVEHLRYTI